jgi:hypothetical protein
VFAPNPTQREMNMGLGAVAHPMAVRTSDSVVASDAVWQRFTTAARTGPVLFTHDRSLGLILYADDCAWSLTDQDRSTECPRESTATSRSPAVASVGL